MEHPRLARLPCSVCKAKVFHPRTGEEIGARKPHQKVPCQTGAGCPKGTPETAHLVELNDRMLRLMEVYQGTRVGIAPPYSDQVARYMLGYLGELMDTMDHGRDQTRLMQMMAGGARGRR